MSSYFCSEAYGHEKLEDTVFENAFIVDKLVDSDPQFKELLAQTKIKQMTAEDICGSNGFTSQVFRLSIVFEKTKND
uniref:Uncharacterized protein n=1 Tax=Ditylenchus dipsaci TaxID=166011 RepID=A0A915DVF4_9BILA